MDFNEELFTESDDEGSVKNLFAEISYRYDEDEVEITEWSATEFKHFAALGRALKKRHPKKTIFISENSAESNDERNFSENKEAFDRLLIDALQVLGVGRDDIERITVYEGSQGGDYRKTLRNAAFYAERYLVGKSLMQHHDPYHEVGTDWDMHQLAEELADSARAVIFSTRDGRNWSGTLRLAVEGLGRAIDSARKG
jgi:hypothetical protein